jgi:hypothetical protein
MNFRTVLLVAGAGCCVGTLAHAHHSIAGVYDSGRQLTLDAVVREFQFVNPHPLIVVRVTEADGAATQDWTLEMDNRWELAELGFEAGTLQAGDRIVVSGYAARERDHALYVRKLDRPSDGFSYQHHP